MFIEGIESVRRHHSWPQTGVYRVHRDEGELYERLLMQHVLLLYGPSNSGKKTLALQLLDRFEGQFEDHLDVRFYKEFTSDEVATHSSLAPPVLSDINQGDRQYPVVYVFADCGSVLDQLSLIISAPEPLQRLYFIATANGTAEDLKVYRFFNWARAKNLTQLCIADQNRVKKLLVVSGKYSDKSDLLDGELDRYFVPNLKASNRSANLKYLNEFLRSDQNTISEWVEQSIKREAPIETSAVAQEEFKDVLTKEVKYIEDECFQTSGKRLSQINVPRTFTLWLPQRARSGEAKTVRWADVVKDLDSAVILGDAGFGKTICLFREIQTRLLKARTATVPNPNFAEEPMYAFYFFAPRIAKVFADLPQPLSSIALYIIDERSGPLNPSTKANLKRLFERGQVIFGID